MNELPLFQTHYINVFIYEDGLACPARDKVFLSHKDAVNDRKLIEERRGKDFYKGLTLKTVSFGKLVLMNKKDSQEAYYSIRRENKAELKKERHKGYKNGLKDARKIVYNLLQQSMSNIDEKAKELLDSKINET